MDRVSIEPGCTVCMLVRAKRVRKKAAAIETGNGPLRIRSNATRHLLIAPLSEIGEQRQPLSLVDSQGSKIPNPWAHSDSTRLSARR